MPKHWITLAFILLSLFGWAEAAPLAHHDIPDPLKTWVPWVLDGEEKAGCPHLFNDADARHCAWPGALELKAAAAGASFTQDWSAYRETWIALPGDEHQWPQDVSVDGKPVAVINRESAPVLKLTPGSHRISGRFAWKEMPESLALPASIGLVRLELGGRPVAQAVRDDDNRLWLQRKPDVEGVEQTQVRVHRKIIDGVPLSVETRIHLEVSGKSRELLIGRALLPELIPKELVSPLPAMLAQDGSLKLQARAGTWDLVLVARHPGPVKALALPPATGLSAEEEVWVFEAAPLLRTASVEGVPGVDPQQTTLPDEWRRLPAYLMRAGASFGLKEIRRGDSDPAPDKLTLARRMWLSFDGRSMSISDRIQGEMSRASRLSMGNAVQLGRVDVAGHDQLITRGSDKLAGVEVKRGSLNLSADSLAPDAPRSFPAVGWKHDFDKLSMELALPAGWRLFHAGGADRADGAWLARWNLLDFFLLLVIALAVGRLWGRGWGVLALLALVLSFQEPDAPRYAWLLPLVAIALLRVLPAGRFERLVVWIGRLSLLALLLITLGFATIQVRGALYPVLERVGDTYFDFGGGFASKSESVAAAPQAVPAPPPAPAPVAAAPEPSEAAGGVRSKTAESDSADRLQSIRSAPKKAQLQPSQRSYQTADPDAKVQTGPGLPDWRWHEYRLSWDGPVRQDQQLDLWLISPVANKILVLLRLVLLALLLARVAGIPLRPGHGGKGFARFGKEIALLTLALAATLTPDTAQAQMPDEKILSQLKEKLMRPADCLPECAEISRLSVQAAGNVLRLGLEVDAAIDTALPLPGGAKQWLPRQARLDGKVAYVQRDEQGGLWLLTPAGKHRVELEGELPARDTLQLPLPRKPRRVDISAAEWEVAGLSDDAEVADTLQLTRRQKAGASSEAPVLPPFLRVERRLMLDLVWHVETTVRRESPLGVPALVQIPLLPGESVTTAGVNVKDGKVLVNLGPQADSMTWSSNLAQSNALLLTAAKDTAWAEAWIVAASTLWHVEAEGIPPVALDANQEADLAFRPWPGESLKLKIERPQAIPGQTLTIDSSTLAVRPGARVTDYQLSVVLRSSRGIDHNISLPAGAILKSVSINGQPRPIRANGRLVTLPIVPGKQQVELVWSVDQGMAVSYTTLPAGLGLASVNSRIDLHMPQGRWLLLVSGPGIGPAILFWGKLLVMLAIAVALGRLRGGPLKTYQWMLLALGLTQVDWWAALLVVGWFFALARRSDHAGADRPRWLFNLRQLAYVFLTLLMLATLFAAVEGGLLGQPEMQVSGNDSDATLLRWYLDRAGPDLSQAWTFSLPIVAYRGLMLAWALWLAWSLLAWLKWGWSAFGQGGLWRKRMGAGTSAETATAAQTEMSTTQDGQSG